MLLTKKPHEIKLARLRIAQKGTFWCTNYNTTPLTPLSFPLPQPAGTCSRVSLISLFLLFCSRRSASETCSLVDPAFCPETT